MENQHYKSYEQAALDILRGNKPEEAPVQEETPQPLSEEIHPDALHVKPVKMGGQTKYKVHAVGKNFSSGIKPGEHLSDSELDDFSEMGGRIKHMKEEAEELDEMGPGRSDPKAKDKEELDQQMKDFMARGGTVQQGKSKTPKRSGRMVARGSLSSGERRVNPQGGKSFVGRMEEVEEDYDQLIQENNAFELELPEQLIFADYLNAAKLFAESYEDAVTIADYFFRNEDESLVIEAFTRSDIEDRIKMHQKSGNETTLPKYGMKDNKPYAEYTVTDKDSGKKTKYIHHGTMRRVERMN